MPGVEFFAGFFDADGAISISRGSGTSYFLLGANISQVDPTPLLYFQEEFGGKVLGPYDRGGNKRPHYRWVVEAATAERFIRTVEPYLVVKAERARMALEFRELFKGSMIMPRGKALDNEKHRQKRAHIIHLREEAYGRMALANKRGVA